MFQELATSTALTPVRVVSEVSFHVINAETASRVQGTIN